MKRFPPVSELTPERFEHQVKVWLESVATPLEAFSAKHADSLTGADGEYTIDVTARFKAFGGASFLLVVECKKHKNSIKREVVQVLHAKQQSLGAQKAMVFSTSSFQSGAIDYANEHGLALVQVVSGQVIYVQANARRELRPIPESAEDYAGFFYGPNPNGRLVYPEVVSSNTTTGLAWFLGIEQ